MSVEPPIHLSPPDLRGGEAEALLDALGSGWVAPVGPQLDAFETELAAATGTCGAVGLTSGTAALHLALLTAGVGAGDHVFVSTFTFVASANAVLYVGATPVFVDSDEASWCIDPDLLVDELERRQRTGTLPRAVVVTDLYGQCAEYGRFAPRCRELGVEVVEDAAEALGARSGGRPAGSLGDIAALSFNGNKLITTSGGGAVVGDDEERLSRIRYLATQARQPVAHYEHTEMGFNYRLSNVLAALGSAQLATLADRIADRTATRVWYAERFAGVDGVDFMPEPAASSPNHWLTCITVDGSRAGFSATDLMAALGAAGIESRPLWKPMHLQPQFSGSAVIGGGVADRLFSMGVALPSAPRQDGFHDRIAAVIDGVIAGAG
ncbi:MAG: DegT/DnrJ/EryC1/StrS family aminotransferase [Actinomycetota bacterium]|nr:DegT/DnrJ/EryC1/StrS family aminotransferase [Actinomycetota bacterium]